ncbi:site-specific integrase [Actinomycetospora lutea]|uniref:tyrosine-type recombinase/integrase n=1 Tax=Actinomycetospora lutea TaxID=663604 RepID=UPI0023655A3D|nr:site-specific integrase [Actinomycetospora lutea]MDD7941694.1 site-specific integrase [Actinomycetospora lutea]
MAPAKTRQRGSIGWLPSGSARVKVYAGIDQLTGEKMWLRETVLARATRRETEREAEKVRTRLLNQVDERRNPRTGATVHELIDRYLEVVDIDRKTRAGYGGKIEKHIRPELGKRQVGAVKAEHIERLYAQLRRCRDHCNGRVFVQHRTDHQHACDEHTSRRKCAKVAQGDLEVECRWCERACRTHTCRPLAPGSIRVVHAILSGAFGRAVRWGWIAVSPVDQTEPPGTPRPNPDPPTPAEAALLLKEAWDADPDWGTLVWLIMTTGSRRGEVCGLRWSRLDLDHAGVAIFKRSTGQIGGRVWEKDTKTHQDRRVTLDLEIIEVLKEHRARCEQRATELGVSLAPDAYVFSPSPDGSTPTKPDSVTQRYLRLAARLGIATRLHSLRHYSATELIAAGVDVRTVAGRLGHSGGGSTTLRIYTAFVNEADQRAATALADRRVRPPNRRTPTERAAAFPED